MRFVLLIFMLLMSSNCLAYSWDLHVTYPDNEVKKYYIGNKVHKIKLPLRKWSCEIDKLNKSHTIASNRYSESRGIVCNAKVGDDAVAASISCHGKSDYDSGSLIILEGDQSVIMMLTCK